jgi:hypothetical protein
MQHSHFQPEITFDEEDEQAFFNEMTKYEFKNMNYMTN